MKIFIFTFIFILIFCSCTVFIEKEYPKYIKEAEKVTASFIRFIVTKKMFDLRSLAKGLVDNIKDLKIIFSANQHIGVSTARNYYIVFNQSFIKTITESEANNYLNEYPAKVENFRVNLMFMNKDNHDKYAPKEFVAFVCFAKGDIVYSYYDHENQRLIEFYREPYEEALGIVRAERPDLLTQEGFESIVRGEYKD